MGRGSTGGGKERLPVQPKQGEGLDRWWPGEAARLPAEAGGGARPVVARRGCHPIRSSGGARPVVARRGCPPSQLKQGEGLDRRWGQERAARPSRSRGGGGARPAVARRGCPSQRSRGKGTTGSGQERLPVPAEAGEGARPSLARRGCPSPPKQWEGLDWRWPGEAARLSRSRGRGSTFVGQERLPVSAEAGGGARLAVARRGCPSQPKQGKGLDLRWPGEAARLSRSSGRGLTGGGQERLPVSAEAGGGATGAVARRGCPSQPKKGEGLDRRWPGEEEGTPLSQEARGAHPNKAGGRGSTDRGQRAAPSQPKQEEGLHLQRPEAAHPNQSSRKGSTKQRPEVPIHTKAGGRAPPRQRRGLPVPAEAGGGGGLDRGARRGCPFPAEAGGGGARPRWPGEAARPSRSGGRGLDRRWQGEAARPIAEAGGGASTAVARRGCPSPAEAGGGARPAWPERLPVPADGGGRAPLTNDPEAAQPNQSRRKGPSTVQEAQRLPIPTKAGGRAPPTEARGCPSQPKQEEGLHLQRPEAAHPNQSSRKGSTNKGQRLPIPPKAGGRAPPTEARGFQSQPTSKRKGSMTKGQRLHIPTKEGGRAPPIEARGARRLADRRGLPVPAEAWEGLNGGGQGEAARTQPKRGEGLDRRWPGEAARPSRSGGRGSTGGGQERLPVPAEAGEGARPSLARRGCPSQPKQWEGLDWRWPGEAARLSRSRGRGSTGGGQERLPVPAEAGGGARPAVARRGCPSSRGSRRGLDRRWGQERLPVPAESRGGLDRRWPGEAAVPAEAGGGARGGGGCPANRELPVPADGGGRAPLTRGQRLPSPTKAGGRDLHCPRGQRLPIPTKAGGRAPPTEARGCPSQPKQEEGLHLQRPEAAHPNQSSRKGSTNKGQRLPIHTKAGGRAPPTEARGFQSQPKQKEGLH
ncbi:collagen alpha-1(I) chain-like [Macrobrachium nipponense]|uniref:collagen alpha-1(I) chain-like n=1 Tax=Macrobrachium nipponense TaxID=159736 RepID=UPI0030C846B9